MKANLNPLAMGVAGAVISAAVMLLLGILGNIGVYMGAVEMMMKWHVIFSLSPLGIIGGMVEAAIISFILLFAFAVVHNRFV